MKSIHYNNRWLRFFFALGSSIFIVLHGIWDRFLSAIRYPSFYVALLVSFLVANLLVYMVHKTTLWLDKKYDWKQHLFERILLQSCLGILGPALVDLIAILSFLKATNSDPLNYLLIDYPVIICLIIFLNIYYLLHYLYLSGGFEMNKDLNRTRSIRKNNRV